MSIATIGIDIGKSKFHVCREHIICPEWGCGAFLEQFSRGNAEVLTILDGASPAQ